jgi:hypothetical protein
MESIRGADAIWQDGQWDVNRNLLASAIFPNLEIVTRDHFSACAPRRNRALFGHDVVTQAGGPFAFNGWGLEPEAGFMFYRVTMRKRRVALAILAALLLLPAAAYYGYFRLLCKEHFYRGLPTSFWARRIDDWGSRNYPAMFPSFVYETWKFCGLDAFPSVLRGDEAAIPVVMDLLFDEDTDVHESAARYGLLRTPRFKAVLDERAGFEGLTTLGSQVVVILGSHDAKIDLALRTGASAITTIRGETWPAGHQLVLMNRDGDILDTVSVSFKRSSNPEEFRHWLSLDEDPDGDQFVFRYAAINGEVVYGSLGRFQIRHDGRTFEFDAGANESGRPAPSEWVRRGLCRVAVRNGQFEVLWPPLTNVSP